MMNPFDELMTDEAYVESSDGSRSGPFKTRFGSKSLTFFQDDFYAEPGDKIIQQLPHGRERKHPVIDVQYRAGLSDIPSSFIVSIDTNPKNPPAVASTNNYHFNNSSVQVGNQNIQNITSTFQNIVSSIDSSTFTSAEKEEAKSKLRGFLENPVVAAVLGGAAQGLISQIG